MGKRRTQFLLGARDSIPLMVAAAPFGIVFGALAQSNGFSVAATLGMSAIVFAGASQFIAVTLLGAGAAIPLILLTVFFVNLRHMLYSMSLMPHVSKFPQALRMIMSFWMTDETYAVVSSRLLRNPSEDDPQTFTWFFLGSAIPFYTSWILFTLIGIVMGQKIPQLTEWGLDIAMVVAFVGIVVPALRNRAQWACAITAFISALLAITVGMILSMKRFKSPAPKAEQA